MTLEVLKVLGEDYIRHSIGTEANIDLKKKGTTVDVRVLHITSHKM